MLDLGFVVLIVPVLFVAGFLTSAGFRLARLDRMTRLSEALVLYTRRIELERELCLDLLGQPEHATHHRLTRKQLEQWLLEEGTNRQQRVLGIVES